MLAAHNAETPLVPASTQKLLTAAAALTTLGADFRFETNVVATSDGPTLDRLWFVGAGDPVIRTAQYMDEGVSTPLEALADAIVAKGVRRIGSIVGDDSRYDSVRFVPSWSPTYRIDYDVGPVGALEVTESIALVNGKPVMFDDPAQYAAAELTRLLRARGVSVGEPTRGVAPDGTTRVASVTSQPLRTIVRWMLLTSNNLTAEMLTKELGMRTRGAGTTAAGVAAVQAALRELGVALDGQTMIDGSGLDRQNRLTCRTLVDVVDLGDRPGLKVLRDGASRRRQPDTRRQDPREGRLSHRCHGTRRHRGPRHTIAIRVPGEWWRAEERQRGPGRVLERTEHLPAAGLGARLADSAPVTGTGIRVDAWRRVTARMPGARSW